MGRPNRRTLRTAYALATAVGVALHELAHKWFAEERGLAVTEVTYFQMGTPAGYVRHETPDSYRAMVAVSLAPFLVNSAVGVAAFVAANWLRYVGDLSEPSLSAWGGFGLLVWLGAACCLHAFPSRTDIGNSTVALRGRFVRAGLPSLQSWLAATAARHWLLWLIVAPLRVVLAVLQTAWFAIRHVDVAVTLPLLAVVAACSRSKRYGSHVGYTVFVFWVATLVVTRYAPIVGAVG